MSSGISHNRDGRDVPLPEKCFARLAFFDPPSRGGLNGKNTFVKLYALANHSRTEIAQPVDRSQLCPYCRTPFNCPSGFPISITSQQKRS